MGLIVLIVLSLVGVSAVVFVLSLPAQRASSPEKRKVAYIAKPLLSETELKFFLRLQDALPEYVIGPQVALAAIIDVAAADNQGPRRFTNRSGFAQKFADFAIIGKRTGVVEAIVELDDYSHDSASAKAKDRTRDKMLQSIGIPVYRFDCRKMPSTVELSKYFRESSG